ncbi:MAG: efflux RND transporter periplasmic adaptor subunit [Steroidobacteraceae bacterium]
MNEKSSLLDQLRIDRPPPEPAHIGRRRGTTGLVIGIVVVLLAAGGGVAYWKVSQAEAIPVQQVVARAITSGSTGAPVVGSLLDASGYVVALRDATVSANNIYKVKEMLVNQGDSVKTGQVIAVLDDTYVRAGLQASEAQLAQARASLAQAQLAADDARPTFQREQKELAEGLISQDTFDTTKASYDAAVAAVEVDKQTLAVDESNIVENQTLEHDTLIRSPFDGVVTVKSAQPGQIVSPSFSGGGGLAEIVDMNSLEVDVDVSENYISRVHPDQPATITLDAYPDWHIPAHVIAIIPTADKSKATVSVRVGFKEGDPRVLPQMGARVSFLADAPPAGASPAAADSGSASSPSVAGNTAVTIPSAAVETNSDSSTGTVFVINGNTVAGRSVRLGARSGDNQWILSGLDPGVNVAIGDFSKLHDGVRVRITQ